MASTFLLIFCLLVTSVLERGILKSLTISMDLSVSPYSLSVFVYSESPLLGAETLGLLCSLDESTPLSL